MVALPKTTHPNLKLYWFLKNVIKVSTEAQLLGMELFCDEQTQVLQDNHRDKWYITYKSEGDGFQCYEICDNGYTY